MRVPVLLLVAFLWPLTALAQDPPSEGPISPDENDFSVVDTASSYTLIRIESVGSDREIKFNGRVTNLDGGELSFEAMSTPYEDRLAPEHFVGLFQNLDPSVGMLVTLQRVEKGETKEWVTGQWDVTMVMRRGAEIMTTGL